MSLPESAFTYPPTYTACLLETFHQIILLLFFIKPSIIWNNLIYFTCLLLFMFFTGMSRPLLYLQHWTQAWCVHDEREQMCTAHICRALRLCAQAIHYWYRCITHSSVFFLCHRHQAGDPGCLEGGRGQNLAFSRSKAHQDPWTFNRTINLV